jgi:hypothetical protein
MQLPTPELGSARRRLGLTVEIMESETRIERVVAFAL